MLHAMTSTNIIPGGAVMFGGLSEVDDIQQKHYMSDLWLFSSHQMTWIHLHSEPGDSSEQGVPAPRAYHRLAPFRPDGYDTSLVLMFGGRLVSGDDTDQTWVLEMLPLEDSTGSSSSIRALWYSVPTTTAPSKRTGHSMSSLGKNSVVLFGGYDQDRKKLLDDTWVFIGAIQNDAQWTKLVQDCSVNTMASILGGIDYPPPRRFASFASFDAETAILFGERSKPNWKPAKRACSATAASGTCQGMRTMSLSQ
jgi:hypothetical protein